MDRINSIKAAHMGTVNSVFFNLAAGIVIGMDDDSIRIWDPVLGIELHTYDADSTDEVLLSALGSMYRAA